MLLCIYTHNITYSKTTLVTQLHSLSQVAVINYDFLSKIKSLFCALIMGVFIFFFRMRTAAWRSVRTSSGRWWWCCLGF